MSDNLDSDAVMADDGFKEPDDAPKKKSTTPPSTQGAAKKAAAVPKAVTNTYVVQKGDHPASVARKLYGRGSMGRQIALLNLDSEWKPGDVLKLP